MCIPQWEIELYVPLFLFEQVADHEWLHEVLSRNGRCIGLCKRCAELYSQSPYRAFCEKLKTLPEQRTSRLKCFTRTVVSKSLDVLKAALLTNGETKGEPVFEIQRSSGNWVVSPTCIRAQPVLPHAGFELQYLDPVSPRCLYA